EVDPPALIDVGFALMVVVAPDAAPGFTVIALDVPALLLVSVAVSVTDSTLLSFVEIVNVPLVSVFVLSPNVPLPSLSNCACVVLLVIVTTVELSLAVTLRMSCAVTVVVNGVPADCGDDAETA